MGPVVEVLNDGWKYFSQVFSVGDVHSIEVVILDDLVMRFDKRIGIVHIHKGNFAVHGPAK